MPNVCSAPNCKSFYKSSLPHQTPGISLHKFPNDENFDEWFRRVGREDEGFTREKAKNAFLCSKHFQSDDFVSERQDSNTSRKQRKGDIRRRKLEKNAIPTIFPGLPEYKACVPRSRTSNAESRAADGESRDVTLMGDLYRDVLERIGHEVVPQPRKRKMGKGKATKKLPVKKSAETPTPPPPASSSSEHEDTRYEANVDTEERLARECDRESDVCRGDGGSERGEEQPIGEQSASHSETGGEESRPSSRVRKQKVTHRLRSEADEESVLEWVAENRCLWDHKHQDFKRKSLKDRMWQDKTTELGYEAPVLVGWYKDIRDFNTRLHKKKSGDGQRVFTDRELWVMRHFEFLNERISHRARPVTNVKTQSAVNEALGAGNLEEAEWLAMEEHQSLAEVDGDSATRKSRAKREPSSASSVAEEYVAGLQRELIDAKAKLTAALNRADDERSSMRYVSAVVCDSSDTNFRDFQTLFQDWEARSRQQQQAHAGHVLQASQTPPKQLMPQMQATSFRGSQSSEFKQQDFLLQGGQEDCATAKESCTDEKMRTKIQLPKKRKRNSSEDCLDQVNCISSKMEISNTASRRDEFDSFGKYIADQLRLLPVANSVILQHQIQSLITNTRLKCLPQSATDTSILISDNALIHDCSQLTSPLGLPNMSNT